jgi:uncharacterized protein involved in exopolysaccharide biosynthesis
MNGRERSSPQDFLALAGSLVLRAVRAAWVGAIVLAAGLAVTAGWTLSAKRLYRSEAVFLYERGVSSASVGAGGEGDSPRQVGTRLQDMLVSRQRLDALIKQMKLYPRIADHRGQIEAIEEMRKHINLAIRDGYTFKASYDSENRELAQSVLDALVKGVAEDDGQRRLREAEETKEFLNAERKQADEALKTKESALSGFLAQHPQLAAETGTTGASTGGIIRAADRDRASSGNGGGEIASLELQAAQLEEALASAGQSAPGLPPAEPGADPVLVAARARAATELQNAQRDLADKQARYTNEHPDVKTALRHVADAEATLRRTEQLLAEHHKSAAASAPAAAVAAESGDASIGRAAALRRALAAVRSQIAAVKSRTSAPAEVPKSVPSLVSIDTEWTRLTRDVAEARERQAQLEVRQFQAQLVATLASAGQGARVVVADPPYRPTRPISGERSKIALVGGVASLLLALLAVALVGAFDDRLYGAHDVDRVVGDTVVIVVPRLQRKGA